MTIFLSLQEGKEERQGEGGKGENFLLPSLFWGVFFFFFFSSLCSLPFPRTRANLLKVITFLFPLE